MRKHSEREEEIVTKKVLERFGPYILKMLMKIYMTLMKLRLNLQIFLNILEYIW